MRPDLKLQLLGHQEGVLEHAVVVGVLLLMKKQSEQGKGNEQII